MKYLISLLLFIGFFTITPETGHALLESDVPLGSYYFSNTDTLKTRGGEASKSLFTTMLKDAQNKYVQEMIDMASEGNKFTNTTLSGDLVWDNTGSFWQGDSSLESLRSSTTDSTLVMGGKTIFIPKGKTLKYLAYNVPPVLIDVNQAEIGYVIEAVKKYKKAIREAIVIGSLSGGVNILSFYPDKQVPVTDLIDMETGDIKPVQSVSIKYALDYFYSPLFGKMDASVVKDLVWATKESEVSELLSYTSSGDLSLSLSDSYLKFIEEDSAEKEFMSVVSSNLLLSVEDRVKKGKPTYGAKSSTEPVAMVDTSLRVAFPYEFIQNSTTQRYVVKENEGFNVVEDIKLAVASNFVLQKEGVEGEFKPIGDYSEFGIDPDSLVVYKASSGGVLQDDGNGVKSLVGAKTIGVVIPLWYKEAVIDTRNNAFSGDSTTTTDSANLEGDIYITGRTIKFANDYSNKITLNGLNKDILCVEQLNTGEMAIDLRKFAFSNVSDYRQYSSHDYTDVNPISVRLYMGFETGSENNGFILLRNNAYLDDPELFLWLESDDARAMSGVDAEGLYAKLQGGFVETKELTYSEWNRLQEIRSELDVTTRSRVMHVINIIIVIFGFIILFYSILMMIAYLIDIVINLGDFSLLNQLTFGRLHSVSISEDMNHLSGVTGDTKYINFWGLALYAVGGISVGLMFIFNSPIIRFLFWVYYTVTSITG